MIQGRLIPLFHLPKVASPLQVKRTIGNEPAALCFVLFFYRKNFCKIHPSLFLLFGVSFIPRTCAAPLTTQSSALPQLANFHTRTRRRVPARRWACILPVFPLLADRGFSGTPRHKATPLGFRRCCDGARSKT